MMLCDFHVHTEFSSDSDASMEAMLQRAISLGLPKLCFTDHMDFDYPIGYGMESSDSDASYLDFSLDATSYLDHLRTLKERYQQQIEILAGVELGLQAHILPQVEAFLKQHSFDFIIGSSHLLYGKDPYYERFWNELGLQRENPQTVDVRDRRIQNTIQDYFEETLRHVHRFDCFQVYGHLDYIVRYAPMNQDSYCIDAYMDLIEEILKTLIHRGRGIELNTSGLRSGMHMMNPHRSILKRYRELGGEIITVGSDAHSPAHIGYAFDQAKQLLLECNFQYYTTFYKQKAVFHKLIN